MLINEPITYAKVELASLAYELALTTNDIAKLDALFWDSPHTLRFGATENLVGYDEIRAFRSQRPDKGLMRTVTDRWITTFGERFAVANVTFVRDGETRIGRQSQTWVKIGDDWKVVAAHVSWMDEPEPQR